MLIAGCSFFRSLTGKNTVMSTSKIKSYFKLRDLQHTVPIHGSVGASYVMELGFTWVSYVMELGFRELEVYLESKNFLVLIIIYQLFI